MKISYNVSKDELIVRIQPTTKKIHKKTVKNFTIWRNEQNEICAINIKQFSANLTEIRVNKHKIRVDRPEFNLGGMWKGIKITDKDIKEVQKELQKDIRNRYDRITGEIKEKKEE